MHAGPRGWHTLARRPPLGRTPTTCAARPPRPPPSPTPPGGHATPEPPPSRDVTAALWLSFEEAAVGCTKRVTLTADASCTACGGDGGGGADTLHACPVCAGSGAVGVTRTGVTVSDAPPDRLPPATPCPSCGGAGTRVVRVCGPCRGTGVAAVTAPVDVAVPPGATAATALRLRGRGHARTVADPPGPPGDAYILLSVQSTADGGASTRGGGDGLDVVTTLRVSPTEAVLGATRSVRTLRGGAPFVMDVPPGSQHGDVVAVLRGAGAGVETEGGGKAGKGKKGRTVGDHVFILQLAVPANSELTDAQLATLLALRGLAERREVRQRRESGKA